jgi:hypothetical protein
MLINELFGHIFKKYDEVVKAFNDALQSDSVGEKHDDRYPVLAQLIEKKILKILVPGFWHRFFAPPFPEKRIPALPDMR